MPRGTAVVAEGTVSCELLVSYTWEPNAVCV